MKFYWWGVLGVVLSGCKAAEPEVKFSTLPPTDAAVGEEFSASWVVDGVENITHTNMHACFNEPSCADEVRLDSNVQEGAEGSFIGTLSLPTAGMWFLQAHARSGAEGTPEQEDYFSDVFEIEVTGS